MMKKLILATVVASVFSVVASERQPLLDITADVIQGDAATESLTASGHVVAVHAPFRMMASSVTRDADQVYRLAAPSVFTTCTNDVGHLHWHVSGDFEFKDGGYGKLRNGLVHFWEVPFLWIPYLYFPAFGEDNLRIMPGYTGRWGTYLMTKYIYHVAGSHAADDPDGWGLDAATRFDLRCRQGIALGETLDWRLGEFGSGHFKIYYAWDRYSDEYFNSENDGWHHENWGSIIPERRYGMEFAHSWEVTERDQLRVQGSIFSDSYFREDFFRQSMFMLKNQFAGYNANEVAWEHLENWSGLGVSVMGPLNDFIEGTARLPEIYFDVNPMPVFGFPVNYESENRFGYLRRMPAFYGRDGDAPNAFNRVPGLWAEYDTFRVDTYHRLTAPMKFDELLSVAPRFAYRGTFWGDAGNTCPTGWEKAENTSRNVFRSILEGGITFSARGTADLGDGWLHMVEPYFDVLAQKAWYSGLADGDRPYVFDAIDASLDWSDQFASRGRNLPYTWYGVTPGMRNVFDVVDEKGEARRVFDIDTYMALQFNDTTWIGDDESHRLAEVGKPNYGKRPVTPVPGFKLRWHPFDAAALSGRMEYDSDNNRLALAGLSWNHRPFDRFKYFLNMTSADFRRWDFASCPYSPSMESDEMNYLRYAYLHTGFEHELCDAVAWSPYMRWDCREGCLDSAGSWIDFRTDCLGFRFLIEYDGPYTRIDGSERKEDWSFGFFIYLRAFGADSSYVFN